MRAGQALHKFLYYSASVVCGYLILKDSAFLPPQLGGKGAIENIWVNYPYQKQHPYFLEFSLIQMGYILEDTVHFLFFKERTSDYFEMSLHHFCTLSLYGGMILNNYLSVGVMISWIH